MASALPRVKGRLLCHVAINSIFLVTAQILSNLEPASLSKSED